MPKYKYVLIDLDDTLFDSSSHYEQAVHMTWEHLRKFYPHVTLDVFKTAFMQIRAELKEKYKYKTLSHQRALLFMRLLEHLNFPFNASLVLDLHNIYWFSVNVYIQVFPETYLVLEKIKNSGMGVVAISDGIIVDRLEKIDSLSLCKYIDYLVSSEEVIDTKPMPKVFTLALKKTGATKEEVIFIGNSFSADVVGGKKFGIDTVWFNRDKKPIPEDSSVTPDFEITNLEELIPILGI